MPFPRRASDGDAPDRPHGGRVPLPPRSAAPPSSPPGGVGKALPCAFRRCARAVNPYAIPLGQVVD